MNALRREACFWVKQRWRARAAGSPEGEAVVHTIRLDFRLSPADRRFRGRLWMRCLDAVARAARRGGVA